MIRLLLLALWVAAVSLGSNDAVSAWKLARASAPEEKPRGLETRKTRIINVPIIAKGQVQGYVVAQFNYVAESEALKSAAMPPDAVILDEAFRMLYAEEKIDFTKLQKADLGQIVEKLKTQVARRLQTNVVKDILVQEFNYVSKDEVRK